MALDSYSSLRLKCLVGLDDDIKNMTLEQEDERYGTFDDFVSRAIEESLFPRYEITKETFPKPDLVWEGWDAAFIESKGCNACEAATLQSTGLDVAIGERSNLLPEKRKFPEFSLDDAEGESPEASRKIPPKVQSPEFSLLYGMEEGIEDSKEYVVLSLAHQVVDRLLGLEMLESRNAFDCKALRNRVFDSAVKFVLTIFDEEDFYRIRNLHKMRREHQDLCYGHCYTPLSPVDWNPKNFSHLYEPDVYYAFLQIVAHQARSSEPAVEVMGEFVQPLIKPLRMFNEICAIYRDGYWRNWPEVSDIPRTLEMMKNFKPLKGCLQAQLTLEFSRLKCFHVLDILFLEAIDGMNLPKYVSGEEFLVRDEQGNEVDNLLVCVIEGMVYGFQYLMTIKAEEWLNVEGYIMEGLETFFGPFRDEVFEVIKLANHERRLGKRRFIGLVHIWSALSFSRVRNMLRDIANNHLCRELCLLDGSSEIYTFRLFTLSRQLASRFGNEKVGLEHLVFSIVFGSSERTLLDAASQHKGRELFRNLEECNSDFPVESWRNVDICNAVFEARCRFGINLSRFQYELVKKVQESLENGRLSLPKEEIRVV